MDISSVMEEIIASNEELLFAKMYAMLYIETDHLQYGILADNIINHLSKNSIGSDERKKVIMNELHI